MEEKKKNWFMRHKIITGIIVFIVIVGVLGAASGSKSGTSGVNDQSGSTNNSNSTPTQEVKQPPMVVDATTLVGDYDKNKIAAQDKYTGKLVQVTAYLTNISNDFTGNYYLALKPTAEEAYFGTSISCYFADKSQKSDITSLENGKSVTVQGKMDDMSVGMVVIKECKIVK